MKKINLLIIIALFGLSLNKLQSQNVNIPDANLKTYLVGNLSINTNGDGEIQVTEATAFGGIMTCENLSISSMVGLEAFVNITRLDCDDNQITNLNVSQNTSLTTLYCSGNQIATLDVSQNTNLTELECYDNQITSLVLNTNLRSVDCADNQLTSIDVNQTTSLEFLECYDNQLTSIDVRSIPTLKSLECQNNQLTSLNVRTGTSATSLTNVDFRNNPNLICIEVDSVAYSTANWTNIDSSASFSTDCDAVGVTKIAGALNEVKLYPNPTTKIVQLDLGQLYETISIQVMTITGQVVLEQVAENRRMMALELEGAAGVYFVRIQTEEGQTTAKILKE